MTHPYAALSPELISDAVESLGYLTDGRQLALNSYENRVLQIGIEDDLPLIAKFYRPARWSDDQILEEHAFSRELADSEIPVVAPLADEQGRTLFAHQGFRFALYPRQGGRWPELDDPERQEWIGRFLGRIHACGAARPFTERPALDPHSFGHVSRDWLLGSGMLPPEIGPAYAELTAELLERIEQIWQQVAATRIRLHGDCHPGNILWTDNGPHFVDLDDCRSGPAVQDLWMLLSGERHEQTGQLMALLDGYRSFVRFDNAELALIEPLRTLRMMHYSAWLARRWDDPAFPKAFPWFNTPQYWQTHLADLQQQRAALDAPPLALPW